MAWSIRALHPRARELEVWSLPNAADQKRMYEELVKLRRENARLKNLLAKKVAALKLVSKKLEGLDGFVDKLEKLVEVSARMPDDEIDLDVDLERDIKGGVTGKMEAPAGSWTAGGIPGMLDGLAAVMVRFGRKQPGVPFTSNRLGKGEFRHGKLYNAFRVAIERRQGGLNGWPDVAAQLYARHPELGVPFAYKGVVLGPPAALEGSSVRKPATSGTSIPELVDELAELMESFGRANPELAFTPNRLREGAFKRRPLYRAIRAAFGAPGSGVDDWPDVAAQLYARHPELGVPFEHRGKRLGPPREGGQAAAEPGAITFDPSDFEALDERFMGASVSGEYRRLVHEVVVVNGNEKELGQVYAELYAETTSGEGSGFGSVYDQTAGVILDLLEIGKFNFSRVVDLGCGPGHLLSRFGDRFDPPDALVGVDLNPWMVELAKSKLVGVNPEPQFVVGRLQEQDLSDYDLVVLSHVLYHLSKNETRNLSKRLEGTPAGATIVVAYRDLGTDRFNRKSRWFINRLERIGRVERVSSRGVEFLVCRRV
ncbi:MAG: class I SAM-dependent methyltransferase [Promethearchaeota archaeon]